MLCGNYAEIMRKLCRNYVDYAENYADNYEEIMLITNIECGNYAEIMREIMRKLCWNYAKNYAKIMRKIMRIMRMFVIRIIRIIMHIPLCWWCNERAYYPGGKCDSAKDKGDGSRLWYVNTWAMKWSQKEWRWITNRAGLKSPCNYTLLHAITCNRNCYMHYISLHTITWHYMLLHACRMPKNDVCNDM